MKPRMKTLTSVAAAFAAALAVAPAPSQAGSGHLALSEPNVSLQAPLQPSAAALSRVQSLLSTSPQLISTPWGETWPEFTFTEIQ